MLPIEDHPLPSLDTFAHTVSGSIDMGMPRGCASMSWLRLLHSETFKHILWLLYEALDAWIAVNPIVQWHRAYTLECGSWDTEPSHLTHKHNYTILPYVGPRNTASVHPMVSAMPKEEPYEV
jgi:hypothetical protein